MDDIIGIDLGTTYSCVAVWKNNKVEVIPNDLGQRTTPSYVAFNEVERLVGGPAKSQSSSNPTNTIFDAKRLIGRKINDPTIANDIKNWPFKVIGNKKNQPQFVINYKNKEHKFFPEEISAMILSKMKEIAENFLNHPVKRAVITVPAYFNDSQRQATKDAAKISGLECLRIINEPTAAALAYGLEKDLKEEQRVMIFDLGGGTFDVSMLAIENGVFEVKATSGDTHLGGEDFDNRLVDFACQEFRKQFNCDLRQSKKSLRKLRTACERAKRILSSSSRATIDIDSLYRGHDFNYVISRAKFEDLCIDLFRKCLIPVKKVLSDAGLNPSDVHEIVLVGGSTRIPKVQELLSQFFGGRQLNKSIHPDEAVAFGAAVQGSVLSDQSSSVTKDIVLLDVTPLSLGVETAGGIMSVIIPRNTPIPCEKTEIYTTFADSQKAVTIHVFEGERQITKMNNSLGEFDLLNISPAPRRVPQIEVTFKINTNGILTVSATEQSTSKTNKIEIVNNKGRLDDLEINKLVVDAERYKEEDQRLRATIEAKNKLESTIYQVRNNLNDTTVTDKISEEDNNKLVAGITSTRQWIEENKEATIEDIEQHRYNLEQLSHTVFTRIYSGIPKPGGSTCI